MGSWKNFLLSTVSSQKANTDLDQMPTHPDDQDSSVVKPKKKFIWGFPSWLVISLGIFLVLLYFVPLVYLMIIGRFRSERAGISIVTMIPTTSLVPTLIFDTPTLLPSLTPTPYRFKPGDPTATPVGSDISDPNFIAGVASYNDGDYGDVIQLMNAVIAVNPRLAPPYRYRGMAYWYRNDCVAGLADQEKALEIDPEYAVAWADRGLLNMCLGNNEQGLADFEQALLLDPSLASVHHNLGVYYYRLGDYEKSLEEYSLSAEIDPTRADAWDGMSEALKEMGRYAECVENAAKAIEIDPDYWVAYNDRGFCWLSINNYDLAIKDYMQYLNYHNEDYVAWYNLGIAQRKSGDNLAAVTSNSKTIELDPTFYQAHINRGCAYLDLMQYEMAITDFNAAIKLGEIPAAYTDRGIAYYYLKNYQLAIADFKHSISLFPFDPNTFSFLAYADFDAGRYQDAINAAEESYQLDPTYDAHKLFEIQARSYYALGNYDQALMYIDMSMNAREDQLGYYYRGIILQAVGRNKEAIQDLESFLMYAQYSDYDGPEVADARSRLAILKP